MDPIFHSAIEPEVRFCLGLRLQPLTVGHLWLLYSIHSAFPDYPQNAGLKDLIVAVAVCSQRSHEQARRMLKSHFAKRCMWLWGWFNRKKPLPEEIEVFGAFLAEQLGTPQQDDCGRGGELRVPLCWRLVAMLMADFGMSFEAAQKTRVAFAMTLWAVEADRRGVNKLASDRQINFRAWAAEMERSRLSNEQLQ